MQFTMDNFVKVITWLEKEKDIIHRIALLGGEPTLHPEFIDFIEYLLPKKLGVLVFTNGMVNDKNFYTNLISVAKKNNVRNFPELGFCVNINEPKYTNENENKLQNTFFTLLGKVSSLSFNIFESSFDPYFLIDTIVKYKLIKNIRLVISYPSSNKNVYLDSNYYSEVGMKIIEFIRVAKKYKIFINFDCGFVRCMFTENNLLELKYLKNSNIIFDCNPVLDIHPNLDITCCYSTANFFKENVLECDLYSTVFCNFKKKLETIKPIYENCLICKNLMINCDGGCRGHKIYG